MTSNFDRLLNNVQHSYGMEISHELFIIIVPVNSKGQIEKNIKVLNIESISRYLGYKQVKIIEEPYNHGKTIYDSITSKRSDEV